MARILIFGLCPLPFENELKSFGPGVRTWQLAKPLAKDGHEVTLVTWRIPKAYVGEHPDVVESVERVGSGATMRRITVGDRSWRKPELFHALVGEVKPDAVVGATIYGSFAAIQAAGNLPVWVDLFGHVMAEAQAKAHADAENDCVPYFWAFEREVVMRGDVFSTVGDAQGFATVGELGAGGRLRQETLGYRFVHTIPCALDEEPLVHQRTVLRGTGAAANDFVLLWSGGYNTWTDVDTLFAALETAMAREPRIRFVSTGGAIDGHDDSTYPRFLRLIEKSPRKDRYVMRGWIPKSEATDHYFEADVGINIDRFMYEGMLGSKNRILDWMRAGLPALTAELSEISTLVRSERLGFSFPVGDADALAREILRLAASPAEVKEAGRRSREYGLARLTFDATTAPLRSWAKEPRRAPDADLPQLLDGFSTNPYLKRLESEIHKKNDYIGELEGQFQKLAALLQEKDWAIAELSGRREEPGGTASGGRVWSRAKRNVRRMLEKAGMGGVIARIRNR